MKKKLVIILSLILVISLIGCYFYYDSKNIALTHFKVSYLDVKSEKVDESLKETSVMFLSDLEYGNFFRKERLDKLNEKLSTLDSDVIVFGGDLFDFNYEPVSDDVTILTEFLRGLKAKNGKFAILGDFDISNENRLALVTKILKDSDFELLNGNNIKIHNGRNDYYNLVGFNFGVNPEEISDCLAGLNSEQFNLAIIHGAGYLDSFTSNNVDFTFSGHSHHTQINYPVLGPYTEYKNTGTYGTGKYKTVVTDLYISNGLGTTNRDQRLFSDPEIVLLRFK